MSGRAYRVMFVAWSLVTASCAGKQLGSAERAAGVSSQETVTLPGPASELRVARERAVELNAACEGCHAEVAAEWRASLHRDSFTNPSFAAAFERERLAFCQSCHAPEAEPRDPSPGQRAEIGVSCVSCHAANDGVLAAPLDGARSNAPHAIVRDARFGASGACAGCHEFGFPDAALRGRVELMQSTLTEQRHSPFPERPCADCHMPRLGARRRSHRFAASRDPLVVQSAVSVRARRSAADRVEVEIVPRLLGHAFPTGDLFRRLEVSAEAIGPEYRAVGFVARHLTRHFVRSPRGQGLTLLELVEDDRVGLDGTRASQIELALGAEASALPVAWRVAYQRVAHPGAAGEPDAAIEAEIEIASGVLELPNRTRPEASNPARPPAPPSVEIR